MSKKEDDVADIVESLLTGEFFNSDDPYEKECDTIAKQIIAKLENDDPKTKVTGMRQKPILTTAVFRMLYGRDDPKRVPVAYMKHAIRHPAREQAILKAKPEQRASIDGPTRAIRVMCFECQGGDARAVRECAAINCFLWPFRMGHNPFFGRLNPEDAEAEANETDEEIEALEAQRLPSPVENA